MYAIPTFQNPQGTTLAMERRAELVRGHRHKLALGLMRAIGAGEYININDNEDIYYVKDINASIILTHLNLG